MNIYFACSITGGREFESVYQTIVHALMENGHEVPTAYLAESDAMAVEAAIPPNQVYSRDVAWIRSCDVLIAEVSVPSHGVGYEMGFALGVGKPVLALYRQDRKITKMISGNQDENLVLKIYASTEEAIHAAMQFLSARV
jgi:nucleoside 2-deoxyribosyltransferase